MATSRKTLLCDICTKDEQTNIAIGFCSQCREMYCDGCQKRHIAFMATQTHTIIKFDSEQEVSDHIYCDSCKKKENKNIIAAYICDQCRELYCDSCEHFHRIFKVTSDHNVSEINITVKTQPLPTDNFVNFTHDFEKFTLSDESVSDPGSVSFQHQTGRINSSYFDEFNIQQDSENDYLAAQFPVFPSSNVESKFCHNKDYMDKISAKVIGSFNGKSTFSKKLFNFKSGVRRDKENCLFSGIICLNDGRLILLDCNNGRLKMFDKTYSIIATGPTIDRGLGMTKISEEEIAVVMHDMVYFYKVTKNKFELNKQRNITLESEGNSISYSRGILAVLCDIYEFEPMIKIYSTRGEEVQILKPNSEPGLIINLDSEEDRIYLSSFDGTFSCLSLNGKLLWKLDFIGGDVAEFNNCLLVADYSGGIVLCSKDGSYRRDLIHDVEHLRLSEYMAYNPDRKQLYVTRSDCDDITIIQLQSELFCRLP